MQWLHSVKKYPSSLCWPLANGEIPLSNTPARLPSSLNTFNGPRIGLLIQRCCTMARGVLTIPVKVGMFLIKLCVFVASVLRRHNMDHGNVINEEKASTLSWNISFKGQSEIQKLPVDICKYCNKQCTAKGTAFRQCEVCYSWVHAAHEGISNDNYTLFNKSSSTIPNIVYYCILNQCYARLSQLSSVANNPLPENIDQNFQAIIDNHNNLEQSVSKFGAQIKSLSKANSALEKKVYWVDHQPIPSPGCPQTIRAFNYSCCSIHCRWIIRTCTQEKQHNKIYILPEAANQSTYEQSFADLCKIIVDADVNVQKLFRIGCKDSSRVRPLLVCFA